MKKTLTFAGSSGHLAVDDLRPLLVTGAQRVAQERRLRNASIVIRDDRRIVAAAVCRSHGDDLRVEEVAIATSQMHDDLADQVIDMLETAALAGGYSRLVVCSTAGELRRALRLLGYVPQTRARRLCFVRRLETMPENRQLNTNGGLEPVDRRSQ